MNVGKKLVSAALAVAVIGGSMALVTSPGAASAAPAATTTHAGSSCLWRYVVTDGVSNDVLVYDGHSSTDLVGRIHPGGDFQSSDPPRSVAGRHGVRLKTSGGWVGLGDWTQLQGCGEPPRRRPPLTVDEPAYPPVSDQ